MRRCLSVGGLAVVARAAAIQDRYDVLLVSYSVTPEVDTPEVLSDFVAGHGIDAEAWQLVTGEAETIYELARESYFADDGRLGTDMSADALFLHTEKMLLVDAEGRLRGIYNGTLPYETAPYISGCFCGTLGTAG